MDRNLRSGRNGCAGDRLLGADETAAVNVKIQAGGGSLHDYVADRKAEERRNLDGAGGVERGIYNCRRR
jgi:hypothetical protein